MLFRSDQQQIQFDYLMIVLSGLIVAGIGFWDDHDHILARWRLLAHFTASAWIAYWMNFQGFEYLIAIMILVWCLNLFNFMDGIDGIAGAEAVFVALVLVFLTLGNDPQMASIAILLAAAVFGFLIWNLPPARIFMGDVGSGFLGLMLGVIILSQGLFTTEFYTGIILFSVFITDATITLLIRIYRGEAWYQAHSCHGYQHMARTFGHFKITGTIFLINLLWLLPIAILTMQMPDFATGFVLLAYLPLIVLAWRSKSGFD